MSSFVLIDTSAWIFALGPKAITEIRLRVSHLVEENLAAATSPIIFEVTAGASSEMEALRLGIYLSSLHLFPLSPEEWIQAAAWTLTLRQKGLTLKTVDALIAYKAIKHRLILLHADKDFDRIAKYSGLRVESLTALVRQ